MAASPISSPSSSFSPPSRQKQETKVLLAEPLRSLIDTGDVAGLRQLIRVAPTPVDLTQPYDDFCTPSIAFRAAELGHEELLLFLLSEGGVDYATRGLHGATLLHVCVRRGHASLAKRLLRNASWSAEMLDTADSLGWRPLHDAAMEGRLQCVHALARAGCDTHAETLDQQTAEALARSNNGDCAGCASCAGFLAKAASYGSYARWRAAGRFDPLVKLGWLAERGRAQIIYVYSPSRVGFASFLFPATSVSSNASSNASSSSTSSDPSRRCRGLPRDLLRLVIRFAIDEPS